jgi:hypothetical protein
VATSHAVCFRPGKFTTTPKLTHNGLIQSAPVEEEGAAGCLRFGCADAVHSLDRLCVCVKCAPAAFIAHKTCRAHVCRCMFFINTSVLIYVLLRTEGAMIFFEVFDSPVAPPEERG